MKYNEILNLNHALNELNLKGAKFAYAVARNIEILKPEVSSLLKSVEAPEEFKAYDKSRVALCEEHAEKDENNKAILLNEGTPTETYKIKDQKAFDKAFKKLKEEHKKVIEAREKQIEEFNKLLEEDKEITLHKLSLKDVPEEITTFQLKSIIDIIED